MPKKSLLVMMRHGESMWNKKNLFTGWVDVPLSEKGIDEALKAGKRISRVPFDAIYVSSLTRAQMTAFIAMSEYQLGKVPVLMHVGEGKHEEWSKIHSEESEKNCIPVYASSSLNERMYGNLQGMDKDKAREEFGNEQIKVWRRSYDTTPPEGESLEMTAKRVIPYFEKTIVPELAAGKNILLSAHGNSLRAIVMFLEKLSKEEVLSLEIPTGEPLGFRYDGGDWIKEDVDEIQNRFKA